MSPLLVVCSVWAAYGLVCKFGAQKVTFFDSCYKKKSTYLNLTKLNCVEELQKWDSNSFNVASTTKRICSSKYMATHLKSYIVLRRLGWHIKLIRFQGRLHIIISSDNFVYKGVRSVYPKGVSRGEWNASSDTNLRYLVTSKATYSWSESIEI